MSLQDEVSKVQENFDSISADRFLDVLDKIRTELKSPVTSKYLQDKIDKVNFESNEAEKKRLCKSLTPYLDWYLKGQ